ncbi:uncharacterized protein N7511_000874 [Penicillium nucicola]|uniref:uncharacterized protein n=1 Tax=Penicillium nucicola TaxID=1850975 RepID=UPI002545A34E|nr:uncharacterized protein N7511_000874 [Penicillium nucicola]KAJ5775863.1 hypothetical protein N7511_000874 [Penicillium nucicola]
MYMSNNILYLGSLLALQACKAMGASATSGVIEVDLVFPRNETYAPSTQMPVVFAIQNPHLVAPLNMRIMYLITPPRDYINASSPSEFNMNSTSSSDSNPYFLYNTADSARTEGTWELTWFVEYGRCTGSSGDIMFYPSNSTIDSMIFTTKSGAAKADLVAASAEETCATGIAAWNVTGAMDVEGARWGGYDTCAVVSEKSPWATVDPCAVKFDTAIASNISVALNITTGGNDSDEKDSGDGNNSGEKDTADNAGAVHLPMGGVTLLTAVFAGLTYILV